MKVIKLIICSLFGLMFINAGLNKFFMYLPVPEMSAELRQVNEAFATIKWLMPLIATVEIIAGLLFIIPKTRALAAIMILPVMVGILLQHLIYAPEGLLMAIILLLINSWIIIENKKRYLPLIS
ncbi:MauE/DoxX family redox-associated membrane protein [Sphingobacterium faecale]|uniref:DoxX family protein n=1 Tax=Sphingobacterium faecale TaxID=2803775 RepID=A0ABS1R613_9SPHI|nr:DoxX family membrane protein [Sphingobacterium faecale]MBL1410134.1 DoxX family protein [Sphingobacterium faecale]